MTEYLGRTGNLVLFANDGSAVIVNEDLNLVVEFGTEEALQSKRSWSTNNEPTTVSTELASAALSSLNIIEEKPGRRYSVPKSVQNTAKEALAAIEAEPVAKNYTTPVGLHVGALLASGNQVTLGQLHHISRYFLRNEHPRFSRITDIPSRLYGGEAAKNWADSVISQANERALTADGYPLPAYNEDAFVYEPLPEYGADVDAFRDALELEDAYGPEFMARVRHDGTGIDRLYRVDPNGSVYVWDDGHWDDLGRVGEDIWGYDRDLDDVDDDCEKTHVLIDPASAIVVSARLQEDPYSGVPVEDIDPDEAQEFLDAIGDIDFSMVDEVLVAAGAVGDGIYTEEERSENATKQLRDGGGKFAKQGGRVTVDSRPGQAGTIERINSQSGTVQVRMDNGEELTVPVQTTRATSSTVLPTEPATLEQPAMDQAEKVAPAIDLSGILSEKKMPLDRTTATLPEDVSVLSKDALNSILVGFPAWVAEQRAGGEAPESTTGDHPLLARWKSKHNKPDVSGETWFRPVVAAAPAVAEKPKAMNPEQSDVQPLYLATVSPEDPRAVFDLIALVPASDQSTSPMTYARRKGKWERDPQLLNDLNSATPPPVVPLDSEVLQDVLQQVDQNSPGDADTGLAASAGIPRTHALMVLWGTPSAIVAAGGADRNRGGAEKLRRYWTVGLGAAKIRWNTPGDWTRCVRHLSKYLGPRAKGYCSLRHKEMTGMWTGDKKHIQKDGRKSRGRRVFSNESIRETEAIIASALVRVQIEDARDKMYGSRTVTQGGRFRIPIVLPEGVPSGDGRTVEVGAATMRNLPMSLMWQVQTGSGHDGSYVVGRIDEMRRIDEGIGEAYGYFDTGVWGAEAERMVRNGFLRFVSADMDMFEAVEDAEPTQEAADVTPAGKAIKANDLTINKARIMGVTIVAKPAFQECTIEMAEPDFITEEDIVIPDGIYVDEMDPLDAAALVACGQVASVIPLTPPRAWFNDPSLSGPTPLTVDDDGRVFGHIATWDTDHIGYNNGTRAPKSRSRYAYFHTGVVRTDDGSDVTVGQLTLAGGHAGMEASAAEAVKHYDDTGSAIADVHAGEDRYGIWVAGALRTHATPEQIRALRASAPSGDWRPIRGNLELVAVCQVNVPGFPTARARVASGQVMALVAAGAATLAKMKSDPVADISKRIAAIEQKDLEAKRAEISARLAPVLASGAARDAENLAAKRKAAADRMHAIMAAGAKEDERPFDLSARLAEARSRFATFANEDELAKKKREQIQEQIENVEEQIEAEGERTLRKDADSRPDQREGKYTPQTQPRDARGRFRDVLARLRDNLGVNGNQEVLNKLEETEGYTHAGDYKAANKAAGELINHIDRLDDGALNAESIGNVRKATGELGKVLANLPLPTTNQAQKIRYSDLPPTLRALVDDMIQRVEDKIGVEDAESAVAPLKKFRSGAHMFSQSEISEHMNVLLRLLT